MISETTKVLTQIREYQARIAETRAAAQDPVQLADSIRAPERSDFSHLVGKAFMDGMRQVNRLQDDASTLMTRFESGEDVPLTSVVMAMQKSSLAFEATLQIRNKVLKAYEDIMNMPV